VRFHLCIGCLCFFFFLTSLQFVVRKWKWRHGLFSLVWNMNYYLLIIYYYHSYNDIFLCNTFIYHCTSTFLLVWHIVILLWFVWFHSFIWLKLHAYCLFLDRTISCFL
jgi:hypothetical protein